MVEDGETQTVPPRDAVPQTLSDLDRGSCIGRYVVLDKLGAGGMGVVYRAYDPDLDRRVALKLVRDLSADATARLVREAQALAKVSHPNIVQIFDVGVFGDTVFIAMELVEGRTLVQWAREVHPPWRLVLDHLIDAGRGLAAAHAAGLVHRDVNPQNSIIGADGRVRVLDFGLARHAGAPAELAGSPTSGSLLDGPTQPDDGTDTTDDETGPLPSLVLSRVVGTPAYMAPEQRRRGTIDARADQFAFAVTGWELLYDARPFEGDNVKQYIASAAAGRFRAPLANTATPPWVRRVLVRGLAAAPTDRYRSMDEILAALAADPVRRRKRLAAVIGAVTATAAITATIAMRTSAAPPCEDAARHLAGVWDATVAGKLEAAFRATGAGFAAETTGKLRAALDRRAEAWTMMHREACRATQVSGEQSAALLDLRMGCLARRRDELRALVGELVATPDAARVASAMEAVNRLTSVAACADRDALIAVVPLPADPRGGPRSRRPAPSSPRSRRSWGPDSGPRDAPAPSARRCAPRSSTGRRSQPRPATCAGSPSATSAASRPPRPR